MSGKVRGGGTRVSSSSTAPSPSSMIPSSTKKTIQNIKDVTGNDCESEIYAMLKECSMDPNETVTKLLLLDTFHEVKRKRDKKKDNASKEAAETRTKPVVQSRGGHSGRSNHPPRYAPHDTNAKSSLIGKDNDTEHAKKESNISAPAISAPAISAPAISAIDSSVEGDGSKVEAKVMKPPVDCATADSYQIADDNNSDSRHLSSTTSPPSAICFSTSDPVLLPSTEARVTGAVGTIKREVVTNRVSGEPFSSPQNDKTGKVADKKHEVPKNYPATRSSQTLPARKVSGNKEWKPKSTPPIVSQSSTVVAEEKAKGQKQDEVKIPPRQHVIIPNHIHVPESERSKLSFGSFDANFAIPHVTQESEGSSRYDEESNNPEETPQQYTPSNILPGNENTPATAEPNLAPVEPSAGQTPTFEVNDSHPRDVSRLQNYVVPPSFDPASYYAQYYRAGADSDGRISPFLPKYSGNVAPEGLNVVPVPRTSQAQPPPCFRPPGLHISHYPPNYIPYPHYFSPFYVPHFLSNQPGGNAQVPVHAHVPGYSIPSVSSGGATPTSDDASSVFVTGQQSEGFGAWVPRDSFFNVPSHVAFANIYAPPQTIGAVAGGSDMVAPVPNPYQQPQHQQLNWPTNY